MGCRCGEFGTIELYREHVSERIKRTRTLRRTLDLVAEHPLKEHKLLKCGVCNQFWQISRAWNWGDFEYLFKVPEIEEVDWKTEPFEQPDELLIHSSMMYTYDENNTFELTSRICKNDTCSEFSIQYSVLCKQHHITDLQERSVLPPRPSGRRLPDYE